MIAKIARIFRVNFSIPIVADINFNHDRRPASSSQTEGCTIDLRALDRHRDAAISSLIPSLSCRSCRPNAPFAELVRLSRTSIADATRIEHTRRILGE
jgi:hypothetical protein